MATSLTPALRRELETELRRLLDAWFPRTLDREHGGFLCNFDHRWKSLGSHLKLIECQGRQTLAAARGAAHFPDCTPAREAAAHGFRYLKDTMWDRDEGGWFRLLSRTGEPLEGATKHGHGSSYAISACVACYELFRDPEYLDLAKSAFAWMEEHAHDERHGGYFVFYRRDGTPILSPDQAPEPGQQVDAIGTPIGCKDANTTSDLLKAFADLYRVWPDDLLRKRLEELLRLQRDRMVVAPGLMHMFVHPDWTPLPDFVRYGQVIRSAHQLLSASEALAGAVDPVTERVARSMVETMFRIAWDSEKGGFHMAGSSVGPVFLGDAIVFVRGKFWWPQADGLKLLLAMARLRPSDADGYAANFVRLWQYAKKYLIDARHGGWFLAGLDTNPQAWRQPKATMWKDVSHEVEGLRDSLLMLGSS
jgi:cellobiose epimerase